MVNNQGYSLIELIVVVGLTAILAIAISTIMISSLLGSNRTRELINIRQSGDYAISQLEQMIRNTRRITDCQASELSFIGVDGQSTTIQFDAVESQIASNSSYLTPDDTITAGFQIECLPSTTNPELIKISFQLSSDTVSDRVYDQATVNFETSIHPRN